MTLRKAIVGSVEVEEVIAFGMKIVYLSPVIGMMTPDLEDWHYMPFDGTFHQALDRAAAINEEKQILRLLFGNEVEPELVNPMIFPIKTPVHEIIPFGLGH